MKRIFEWLLACLGAIMCIGGAASIWTSQSTNNPPGSSLWPMPAFLLVEVVLLGLVGFCGIALEPKPFTGRWGFFVWMACGALLGLSILGATTVSVIVLLAAPALAFGGAAILADIRRGRKILPDVGILTASGIVNLGIIFAVITLGS